MKDSGRQKDRQRWERKEWASLVEKHPRRVKASPWGLAMNKLRYKDGKGDPKGFISFLLDNNLPKGLLPRYRGNRLHSLFHLCGQLISHYHLFLTFLSSSTLSCGGLCDSLLHDMSDQTAVQELCVLALIGRLLSAPWMKTFYTSAQHQMEHIQGIAVVKQVVEDVSNSCKNRLSLLTRRNDFFLNRLSKDDPVIESINQLCSPSDTLQDMIVACLSAVLEVLVRQYDRYFKIEDT